MKKFLTFSLVLAIIVSLFVANCGLINLLDRKNPTNGDEKIFFEDIDVEKAYALTQENENNNKFLVLDVRTPGEFSEGHIKNAINLDYSSATFKDDLNVFEKNYIYLVYCRSGGRSKKAMEIMQELDFKKVYNMLGGFNQWKSNGFPVVKD